VDIWGKLNKIFRKSLQYAVKVFQLVVH